MIGYLPQIEELAARTSGYRIRFYRIRSGLTQKQLAERCSLSESAIRNYELDNRSPDPETLEKIAAVLGISVYALAPTDLTSAEGVMHALFDMGRLYGLHPEKKNGRVCLVFDSALFDQPLDLWLEQYRKTASGKEAEESFDWQSAFRMPSA